MKTATSAFSVGLAAYLAIGAVAGQSAQPNQKEPADSDIRQLLMRASVAAYDGPCPCPDTVTANGRLCGDSSAYRRQGGKGILCYVSDVTDAMVLRYRNLAAKDGAARE